jgi:hypothetical protein
MTTTRRRLRAATAALALPLLLVSLAGVAACGDEADAGDDGVASIDKDKADDDGNESDDSGDGGGATDDERPVDDAELQDAMLEYAQCMRDHGVDMPDPEFSDDGGVRISAGPADGGEGGPDDEDFEAADEACQPIIDDAMPDMEIDPEQQAEMQDQLVEVAECMREKGYDMPDPEVDDKGRVTVRGGPGEGSGGPGAGDEEFEQDMEDCGGGPERIGGGDDDDDGPQNDEQTDESDTETGDDEVDA